MQGEMTEEELESIEESGRQLMSPREAATIAGVDWYQFKADYDGQGKAYLAYQRGALQRIREMKKVVLDLATAGSAPAQELALKYLKEFNIQAA